MLISVFQLKKWKHVQTMKNCKKNAETIDQKK